MATQIGVVKALIGEVTATAADGSIRTLQIGDMVYANELVSTGEGGAVEIEFADGSVMDLGRNSQAMLDSEVFDPSATAIAETASDDVPDDIAAIQQALLEGEDPTQVGEATAAGAGVEDGNEGHEPVFVDYLNPIVTPDAGFDTIGVSNSYDLPEEDIIILEEEEEAPPVVPVVSVSVDVEIEIEDPQSPPPENGVPTPEYPVLVNGNAASVLEGTSEGTKQVVFIINLSEPFSQDVQVTYILQPVSDNGAADNPDDWFNGVSPQTVTIPAGSTSFPVYVEIVEDNIPEANGVFEIVLISANNATINPDADSATVTIYDDDVTLVSDDVSGDETDGLVELDGVIDADFGPGDTGSISVTLTGGSWVGTATASTNTLTADDGSWTLVVNNDGTYTFTQNEAFDHPDTTNPDDPLTFEFTATATDSSGNTSAPSVFTVTVNDDGPTAQDDAAGTIAEDSSISVDVLANDAAGADGGKALVSIDTVLDPSVGTVSIVDGEIVFTAAAGFEGDVSIDYTMQDAEGDTDNATLTLTVGPDSVPVLTSTNAAVDETGGLDSVNGTLTIDFGNDESGSTVTLSSNYDAATTTGNTLTANDGSWQLVRNANGTYTFTQLAAMDHTGIADNGSIDIEFTVDVVDGDGTPGTESFTVSVYDDGPVVTDNDANLVNEAGSLANILSYDLGEDGLGDSGSVQLSYNGPALKSGGDDVIFTSEDVDGDGIYDLVGKAGGEEVIRIAQSLPDASPEDGSYSIVMSDVIDLPIVNIEVPLDDLAISGSTGTYSVGGDVVLTLTGSGNLKLSNAGGSDKLGVGNNNMDPGETLTFDFGGDVVNGLALDLFDNADGYQYSYEATLADGTTVNSGLITGAGSSNIEPIDIPGGYTSITITVEDDGSLSQPKFKISGISYDAEDPQGITLDFGYTATDGDGDVATGDFEVTIDPSATVNAITGTPDVISHPDTQVDPS